MDDPRTADLTALRLRRASAESDVWASRSYAATATLNVLGGCGSMLVAGLVTLDWAGLAHPLVVVVLVLLFAALCSTVASQVSRRGKAATANLQAVSRELAKAEGDAQSQAEAPDGL